MFQNKPFYLLNIKQSKNYSLHFPFRRRNFAYQPANFGHLYERKTKGVFEEGSKYGKRCLLLISSFINYYQVVFKCLKGNEAI